MKLLLDMNVSPLVATRLNALGVNSIHWSEVGNPRALDPEIMEWARNFGHIVVTHDLDYGALLHATGASGPTVIQFRDQDIRPQLIVQTLIAVLNSCGEDIYNGSLITIATGKVRVAILPLRKYK
jgi:predicted nuclease of predicted toxin-antitoxin system